MKAIIKTFASLCALALTVASCQLYEIDTQMTPEKAAASLRLVCDALDSYTLPAQNSGAVSFHVSANTPWTITRSSGADWLTVSPSSSAMSSLISDVVVDAENNNGEDDRQATLTLKAEGVNQSVIITIKQLRDGQLFVTPIASDFTALGGQSHFTLLTNQEWTIRSSESWLSFNRDSGHPDPDGNVLTILATAEKSNVMERMAIVTITAGEEEETFEVLQKGKLEITEISDAFTGAGGKQIFGIRTDLPWTINADKNWLSFDVEEGEGDGSRTSIAATAAPNEGATRITTVTVTAGGVEKSFEVSQTGAAFDIVVPASTEIDSKGGEMILEVKTTLPWTPECDQALWAVEKVDESHMKVTAPWNGKFAPITGKVAIVSGANRDELVLTQDVNFSISGSCEILSDGSVKLTGGGKPRVTTKDSFRYVKAVLTMGECHFASGGQLWFTGAVGGANIYNQITIGGNTRTRTDGNDANGVSTYKSTSFSISESELNTMTSYGVNLLPNEEDPALLHFEFVYNGEVRGSQNGNSAFAATPDGTVYWFGFWDDGSSDTWYIVKSCEIIAIPE